MGQLPNWEKVLTAKGYPSTTQRRDLWAKPRAAIGIAQADQQRLQLIYSEGAPRVVVAYDVKVSDVLAYASGAAFSKHLPLVIAFNEAETKSFVLDGAGYVESPEIQSWESVVAREPGRISSEQAQLIVEEIAEGNRKWYQDERSRRVVGVLPRIFPEGTAILYELLQNAADTGATKAAFELEGDDLLFVHDGCPFTENDVYAISFVNSSYKPLDTIGFMGLGFKAAYEVCDQPEIHSPPFHFRFDKRKPGGELFCEYIGEEKRAHVPSGYTTLFRLPIKLIFRARIDEELSRFDGRPLLYIGKSLRKLTTPGGSFEVLVESNSDGVQHVYLGDSRKSHPTEFMMFSLEFQPSSEGVEQFARSRGFEPGQYLSRKQRISITIQLANGEPAANRRGCLQAYLPTRVELPVAFDIQGNFLLDASRQQPRDASGPWNAGYFVHVVDLVAQMLGWAKRRESAGSPSLKFYDLIPEWRCFCDELHLTGKVPAGQHEEESEPFAEYMESHFSELLNQAELVPAVDSLGNTIFTAPRTAVYVDEDIANALPVENIASLANALPISPRLTAEGRSLLAVYIERFGPRQLAEQLSREGWENLVSAFKESPTSKEARTQLARLLSYLYGHWTELADSVGKWRVVLTQAGRIRAKEEIDTKPLRSLPPADVEVPIPTDELAEKYDIAHVGLRRELSRPAELGIQPSETQAAIRMLDILAPALVPETIAKEIIVPVLQGDAWKQVPDDRLLRYTRFLMLHSETIRKALPRYRIVVKVRVSDRLYAPPDTVYFGVEYSSEGELIDRLCGDTNGVVFLADDYLKLGQTEKSQWLSYFSLLGVSDQPRIVRTTEQFGSWQGDALREALGNPPSLRLPKPRASDIYDSQTSDWIWGDHYALDDFALDPLIAQRVHALYQDKPLGWKDALSAFATLLDSKWDMYETYLVKRLRRSELYSQSIYRERMQAPSTFTGLLTQEPWIPVMDLQVTRRPGELVLNTPDNRSLAGEDTAFPYFQIRNEGFIRFLGIHTRPPDSTPLSRLQSAVDRKVGDIAHFTALYQELAHDGSFNKAQLRQAFLEHPLVFIPEDPPAYRTSDRILFSDKTVLGPVFSPIGMLYPELKDFFVETLGVPADEHVDHCVRFLKDYLWKEKPPINDNIRSAIESCYRRFFNYLNETEEVDRQAAIQYLKDKLGTPTVVFCAGQGWVRTNEKTVVFPDTRAYDIFLGKVQSIASESHLRRLPYTLSELEPLLDVMNVKPVSRLVRVKPQFGDEVALDNGEQLQQRLSLLIRQAIRLVEMEQSQSESTSRNLTLFVREWERLKVSFSSPQFYRVSSIRVAGELTHDGLRLFEESQKAYVAVHPMHVDIYIVGNMLNAFDAVASQLATVLRFDLLPPVLREELVMLVQANLARLDQPVFESELLGQLRSKGLNIDDDQQLKHIMAQATRDIEESAIGTTSSGTPQTETQGNEGVTQGERPSTGAAAQTGSSSGYTSHPSPPLTADEVLSQLPQFDDESFGQQSTIDLSAITEWQTPATSQSGKSTGGSGRGGGSFRNMRAYHEAYGIRGEEWVFEQEKRALIEAGRAELASQVVHRSKIHEGSPCDIESFEKVPPFAPIYVEVKSTSDSQDLEIVMSAEEIREALQSTRPYLIYRVVAVNTRTPKAFIYDFKKIAAQLKFSATNVSIVLPKPQASGTTPT